MMRHYFHIEWLIAKRTLADVLQPALFYCIVVSLGGFALGNSRALLPQVGPYLIWIAAMLAVLLRLNTAWVRESAEGTFVQILFSRAPLEILMIKLAMLWLTLIFPMLLFLPIFALWFALSASLIFVLALGLTLGLLTLILLTALGLTLFRQEGEAGILVSILILPIYLPVFIFGIAACEAARIQVDPTAPLSWLAAITLFSILVLPRSILFLLRATQ